MKQFDLQIFDPPKEFESKGAPKSLMGFPPVAALFTGKGAPTEICRLYGYLMLLGQNLEIELRVCLTWMQLSFALRGITPRFNGNPEKAKFDKLIEMFAAQLNIAHSPTKEFVNELHRARKLRNRLAHGFIGPGQGAYFITHGGQQAILHRLKLAEKIFFPVIMLISSLSRGYAADLGETSEVIERRRKEWDTEQHRIDEELKDILDDESE